MQCFSEYQPPGTSQGPRRSSGEETLDVTDESVSEILTHVSIFEACYP